MHLDFKNIKILVVGDVMLDEYLISDVKRISSEAPVPIALVKDRWVVPGGAANVARNLTHLGVQTFLIGACGVDNNAKKLQEKLQEEKIVSHLVQSKDIQTITKTRVLAHGQQLLRIDEEKNCQLNSSDYETLLEKVKAMLDIDAIILSDYGKNIFIKNDANNLSLKIIKTAHEKNIPVFVDPKGLDWSKYYGADCVTPNENEFLAVAKEEYLEDNFIQKAKKICQEYNLRRLLVTRGAKGMSLYEPEDKLSHFSSVALEVADVSGAGDTSIATLTACLANKMSWENAIKIANVAAGIVVGKIGTAAITIDELNNKLGEYNA